MQARCDYHWGTAPVKEMTVVQLSHAPRSKDPQWQHPMLVCKACREYLGRHARRVKGAKIVVEEQPAKVRIEVRP